MGNRKITVAPRWAALKLLEYDDHGASISTDTELDRIIVTHRRKIHQVLEEDLDIIIADSRYSYIHQITQGVTERPGEVSASITKKRDRIVLDRWLGIPIFLGVCISCFCLPSTSTALLSTSSRFSQGLSLERDWAES